MSKTWIKRRDNDKAHGEDSVDDELARMEAQDGTFGAGGDGLTGPELAAEHRDEDEPGDDAGGSDAADPHQYEAKPTTPLTASLAVDGLAREYINRSLESLQRTPSVTLSDSFRAQLLHLRDLVTAAKNAGVTKPGRLVATLIGVLAVDQRGKVDAISLLRQCMRQVVWLASVDVQRWRRAEERLNQHRRAGEEDAVRAAPYGMEGMSDHSDAIQGVKGSSEAVLYNEADVISAMVEANAFFSAFADTLCDDANDRIYLGLEHGLQYIDIQLPNGLWAGIHDPDQAIDIQLIQNAENQRKRDIERAGRRKAQVAALAAFLDQ